MPPPPSLSLPDLQYAEDPELDAVVDPSNPPRKGCNLRYVRWLCLRTVQQLWFRLLTVALILADLALIAADLAIDCPAKAASRVVSYVDLVWGKKDHIEFTTHTQKKCLDLLPVTRETSELSN